MAADLPADALAVAFAHLDVSALLACTAVCADWRRVARALALDRARAEREAYWAAMRLRVRSDAYHLRHLAMAARADTCAIPRYVCAACGAGVAELGTCACRARPAEARWLLAALALLLDRAARLLHSQPRSPRSYAASAWSPNTEPAWRRASTSSPACSQSGGSRGTTSGALATR